MGQLKFNFMNLTLIDKEQRNWSKRKVIIEFMRKKSSVFETLDGTVIQVKSKFMTFLQNI